MDARITARLPSSAPGDLALRAAVRSVGGRAHPFNEDAALADADHGVYVVADGTGDHGAAVAASAIAAETVRRIVADAHREVAALAADAAAARRVAALLSDALKDAHTAVRGAVRSDDPDRPPGASLDVAVFTGGHAHVGHVGCSRTYLVRDGIAIQLTRDHPIDGAVGALGGGPAVDVDLIHLALRPGDQLLLCSAGLHACFTSDELGRRLTWDDPVLGLTELVELAWTRGGDDDITGVLVEACAAEGGAHASGSPWPATRQMSSRRIATV
jgi:serine/threonine protein phosphatase PrpC